MFEFEQQAIRRTHQAQIELIPEIPRRCCLLQHWLTAELATDLENLCCPRVGPPLPTPTLGFQTGNIGVRMAYQQETLCRLCQEATGNHVQCTVDTIGQSNMLQERWIAFNVRFRSLPSHHEIEQIIGKELCRIAPPAGLCPLEEAIVKSNNFGLVTRGIDQPLDPVCGRAACSCQIAKSLIEHWPVPFVSSPLCSPTCVCTNSCHV